MKRKNPLLVITGPTGIGKTDLIIALYDIVPLDIISVDSVQIYKHLNIGSGKPSKEILSKYPHKLINKLELHETYSTGSFRKDAITEIMSSTKNERIPALVGGTMMYFKSLFRGLTRMPKANKYIRKNLSKMAELEGWPYLHRRLSLIDPEIAEKIHPNDSQRIQRALEVYQLSSRTMTDWHNLGPKDDIEFLNNFKILQFAIKPESRENHRNIVKKRFEKMIEDGLINEAQELLNNKAESKFNSMKSLGYKQVCEYLEGSCSYDAMLTKAVTATRQLAKRQMTWLRSWKNLNWISQNIDLSVSLIKQSLKDKS